jgi:hypothetical protein
MQYGIGDCTRGVMHGFPTTNATISTLLDWF